MKKETKQDLKNYIKFLVEENDKLEKENEKLLKKIKSLSKWL